MATLESKVDNAFNMHTSVFVDDNKVTHLFQVEEGPSSTSYGIEIAQLAGFPEKILKRARDQNETEQWTENICAKVCSHFETASDFLETKSKPQLSVLIFHYVSGYCFQDIVSRIKSKTKFFLR